MAQNSFFLDAMDREAIKVPADAHPQNSLPGKVTTLKLLKPSLKTPGDYIELFGSQFLRVEIFNVEKFSKFFVRFHLLTLYRPPHKPNHFLHPQ